MTPTLVVVTPGKQQGQVIPIAGPTFLIGRDPKCQLRPASDQISRYHSALQVRDGKAFVRDLKSTNGTFVNGRPVRAVVELLHEDRLRVGPLEFEVRIEPAAPAQTSDDEAAALLLSVGEENPSAGVEGVDADGIPTGGTAPSAQAVPSQPGAEKKVASGKPGGDTSAAAKAILDQYMRRARA